MRKLAPFPIGSKHRQAQRRTTVMEGRMSAKSLRGKDNRNLLGATNISPADFPLGSPESRAAARAILGSANRLSQTDEDALTLYSLAVYVNKRTSPSSDDLENTGIYRRGKELHLRQYGPPLMTHQDPHHLRLTTASLNFEIVFGREPRADDVLSFAQLREWQAAHPDGRDIGIKWFIEAWERQLPEMPCPLNSRTVAFFIVSTPRTATESNGKSRCLDPRNMTGNKLRRRLSTRATMN